MTPINNFIHNPNNTNIFYQKEKNETEENKIEENEEEFSTILEKTFIEKLEEISLLKNKQEYEKKILFFILKDVNQQLI